MAGVFTSGVPNVFHRSLLVGLPGDTKRASPDWTFCCTSRWYAKPVFHAFEAAMRTHDLPERLSNKTATAD
jgi:hypothetical protein